MPDIKFDMARRNMVEQQVRPWKVFDESVLDVMSTVPREHFVPEKYRNLAYADWDIPLAQGQVMSAPKLIGRILETLAIKPGERVLEIGTGSGYLTACLAALGAQIESVEYFSELADNARGNLGSVGYAHQVSVMEGNAVNGWMGTELYDAIVVTASLSRYRDVFEQQLKGGGRLVIVVGAPPIMQAILVRKAADAGIARTPLFETCLPRMIGEHSVKHFAL